MGSPPTGYTSLNTREQSATHLHERRRPIDVSIRIKEHLDEVWQEWLEGLRIVHEPDGTSRLSGILQDQAALHGVLTKLNHLSLTLLSLESRETRQD